MFRINIIYVHKHTDMNAHVSDIFTSMQLGNEEYLHKKKSKNQIDTQTRTILLHQILWYVFNLSIIRDFLFLKFLG